MLVPRIWGTSKQYRQIDDFCYSHYLFPRQCTDIVKRNLYRKIEIEIRNRKIEKKTLDVNLC